MWLLYLIVPALVAGVIISFSGAGVIGIPLAAIALLGLVAAFGTGMFGQRTRKPSADAHGRTGHAHEGQEHMVP